MVNQYSLILTIYILLSFIGDWGRWVIYTEVTNEIAYITNELKDPNQVDIPVDQWMYSDGIQKWKKDETMRVEDEASGVDSNRLGKMFGRMNFRYFNYFFAGFDCKTIDATMCIIPFKFNGQQYDSCMLMTAQRLTELGVVGFDPKVTLDDVIPVCATKVDQATLEPTQPLKNSLGRCRKDCPKRNSTIYKDMQIY